ncbi:MAG: sulfur carrier protein ThiS [Phascolarctobacterium sp.]|nr:sulfur carrier protein ThiS [Phascolarctobacterium sp.]
MIINGKNESLERNMTLAELLEQLGYRQNLVAVELNGQIVKRAEYVSTMITVSDKLEIVSFVGGG